MRHQENLTEFITLRFAPGDHQALWHEAIKERRTVASFCRNILLTAINRKPEDEIFLIKNPESKYFRIKNL